LDVCILLRVWDPGDGGFIPSTQRYYRRLILLLILLKLLHVSVVLPSSGTKYIISQDYSTDMGSVVFRIYIYIYIYPIAYAFVCFLFIVVVLCIFMPVIEPATNEKEVQLVTNYTR
jgi:hypothetical protein